MSINNVNMMEKKSMWFFLDKQFKVPLSRKKNVLQNNSVYQQQFHSKLIIPRGFICLLII